ncbi:MAG: TetR family transcriptional regulator [Rhodoferax ferrireducens]|uniref:TetR family transcriptional regulator n=1 Tax=Rhodoferax ferrireducens TaxID=192843 RepID=A0A1W9KZC2_9BURK|nr:MAG: TetR family transcriptional regulator [Rhodoferax ferrireducens]
MPATAKPLKQRTQVRQASLVEAALQLAAERSPANITTTDLANAVGITQGAVFRHFASKEAIWLAVMDGVTEQLMGQLQAAAQTAAPNPVRALEAVFMAHVAFVVAYPGVPRVIFQELQQPQDTALKARVRQLMQQYRTLLMHLLLQAQQEDLIAPQADLTGACMLFIGAVQGLVMQSLMSGDVAAMTQLAPGVFALYRRGLCASPATAQPDAATL